MTHSESAPRAARFALLKTWLGALGVGVLATMTFGSQLAHEPSFVDEWAYLSQTYYADLWFEGETQRAEWLDYPAYDLPPLPKYVFGAALELAGYRRPGVADANRWYENTHSQCGPFAMLVAARWPTVFLGALGCMAIYGIGTVAFDRRVGFLSALLLMFNPLYRTHSRRAMSDVIAECFILCALLAFMLAWRGLLQARAPVWNWLLAILAGFCAGLAPLAKLNGALAMMIVVAWCLLTGVSPSPRLTSKLKVGLAGILAGVLSLVTFIGLNPFLTAQPPGRLPPGLKPIAEMGVVERLGMLVTHRVRISQSQMKLFPHNALPRPTDKLGTLTVQGFGRFGPFGPSQSNSVIRYDWKQDRGALLWLPLVLMGGLAAYRKGGSQYLMGSPPGAWAVLAQAVLSALVVMAYLPLAWDRYYLSLQPGAALLGAAALVAGFDLIRRRPRSSEANRQEIPS